jgi:hypothetical protein
MVEGDLLANGVEKKPHLMLKLNLLAHLPTVKEATEEITDHGKHFGVHVKQAIEVMHAIIENPH